MTRDEAATLFDGPLPEGDLIGAAEHRASGSVVVFEDVEDGRFLKDMGYTVRVASPEDVRSIANAVRY